MTRNEELALVIQLACITEDRDDAEQRALIAWAWDCDKDHNRNTITNRARRAPNFELQDLVSLVQMTRVIEPERKQHEVKNPNRWKETWAMWIEGR